MLRRSLLTALVAVAAAGTSTVAPDAAAATSATLTATPATGLVDLQMVHFEGDGFAPSELYEIFECAGDSVDEFGCDPNVAFDQDSDGVGHFSYSIPVDARIYLGPDHDVAYDCRTEPAGCRVGVGVMAEPENTTWATLEFDPTVPLIPPVSATVEPSVGLVDGATVAVHGENLSPYEYGFVFQCRTGGAPRACDHDRSLRLGVAPDRTLSTELTVRRAFRSPLGDDVNCSTPGECSIVVSWGFAFVPDRFTEVPLTFAAAPTTSPPTTAPPVSVAAPTTVGQQLPRTGGSAELAAWGVLLLALGGISALIARRRRTYP